MGSCSKHLVVDVFEGFVKLLEEGAYLQGEANRGWTLRIGAQSCLWFCSLLLSPAAPLGTRLQPPATMNSAVLSPL